MPPFTLALITDLHYTPGLTAQKTRRCGDSLRKLAQISPLLQTADLRVQLGDLINGTGSPETDLAALKEGLAALAPLHFLHLTGNHDAFHADNTRILPALPEVGCVWALPFCGVDLIALDPNFHADGRPYSPEGGDWTDTAVPPAQLAWLRERLAESRGAIVFSHQNLDSLDDPHVVRNAAEVRAVLEASGKVRFVFQGHCHAGRDTVTNGIRYHTLPALCEEDRIPFCLAVVQSWDDVEIFDRCERL